MNNILAEKFFLYTGKCNATAINKKRNPKIYDQHGVVVRNPDIDQLEGWGTLKVYCPSFLTAFKRNDLTFANQMIDLVEKDLKKVYL